VSQPKTTMADDLFRLTGVNVTTCYQCGKCSAGCPMAGESDLRPHNVMRLAMNDRRNELLNDESIWLCLTCETCSERCPNGCDPARIIDAVREIAAAGGYGPQQRNIRAFHDSFLGQIHSNGRLYEAGFMLTYKLRSGALLADASSAPGMLSRGKLQPRRERIRDLENVRRIFKLCEEPAADEGPAADAGPTGGARPAGDAGPAGHAKPAGGGER
jgi:heterodisulfide reductase subunit C